MDDVLKIFLTACENCNTVPLAKVCIQALVRLPLQGCFIFSLVKYKPLTYNKVYEYPDWAVGIGWTLALTSMICIPMVVVIKIIRSDGPLIEVGWIAVCYLAVTSVYLRHSCKCLTTQNIQIGLLYVSSMLASSSTYWRCVSVCLNSVEPFTELSTHQRLWFSLFIFKYISQQSTPPFAARVRLINGNEDTLNLHSAPEKAHDTPKLNIFTHAN